MIDTSKLRALMRLTTESLDSLERNGTRTSDKALYDLKALAEECQEVRIRISVGEGKNGQPR